MTQVQAGAAAVTVTPPLGGSVAGSYGDRGADGVLTDLHARALVLDDGVTHAALVTLDVCAIDPEIAAQARERVECLTGIPATHVLLTCTHTHSGPATYATPWYEADTPYLDVLTRRIADAVALAHQRRRPARLLIGCGREESLPFNRRYWMKDGTVRTNPGVQNPDIVRPAGPTDPEIGVLRVEDMTGLPIAVLVNMALHVAVVGGTRFSADYPGVLAETIRRVEGPETVVLFTPGCCGDINHLDVSQPEPQHGQATAERIGRVLAGNVLAAMARLVPVDVERGLRIQSQAAELPYRIPTAEEVARAHERYPFVMQTMDAQGLEAVAAHRAWWVHGQERPTARLELQALAIGELAYLTLPAEIFVELGLAIKERSPFVHTLIGTLNGSAIDYYIATEKAYAEGGYEVTNSPVQPGSGEALVDAALNLLHALRTGDIAVGGRG